MQVLAFKQYLPCAYIRERACTTGCRLGLQNCCLGSALGYARMLSSILRGREVARLALASGCTLLLKSFCVEAGILSHVFTPIATPFHSGRYSAYRQLFSICQSKKRPVGRFLLVALKSTRFIVCSNLLECLCLNLTDTLTSHPELLTHLFKGMVHTIE